MKKRGIVNRLSEMVCGLTKHEYEYIECGKNILGNKYFLYRCRECGKNRVIYRDQLLDVDPVKAVRYPVEKLVLPAVYGGHDNVYESREVGYLISRYWEKEGILISAYWNHRERNS